MLCEPKIVHQNEEIKKALQNGGLKKERKITGG